MSIDEKVTKDLVKTLENGREGFEKASKLLADTNESELATKFAGYARDRARMSSELTALAGAYGDDADEESTPAGAVHRGWMAVKDALSGHDAKGVLKASLQGEDHAVTEYEKASKEELSPGLRTIVARQMEDVTKVRDEVRSLQESHSG